MTLSVIIRVSLMSNCVATLFDQFFATSHTIHSAVIDPDGNDGNGSFILILASGHKIVIEDSGQCCCEQRYLHTSDDLDDLVGDKLVSIQVDGVKCLDESGEEHEVAFLKVSTNRDSVVIETHNEHNGYYGGFSLKASVTDPLGNWLGSIDLDTW